MTDALTIPDQLEKVRHELAVTTDLDYVLDIRDQAAGYAAAIKAAKLGVDISNKAAEIKLRAERKAGEMLAQLERGKTGPKELGTSAVPNSEYAATLATTKTPTTTAKRWQQIATIPEEIFEQHIAETVSERQELTTAGIMRLKQKIERDERASGKNQPPPLVGTEERAAYVASQQQARTNQAMAATVYSNDSLEYYTPKEITDLARAVMGGIDLDPASNDTAQSWIQAATYYTEADDGYEQSWHGRVWLNPPYSYRDGKSNQMLWGHRLSAEYQSGNVEQGILLVKAALGYQWFEQLWDLYPVCFLRDRVSFVMPSGDDSGQSKQGTALFYMGDNLQEFITAFSPLGRVIVATEGYYVTR